MTSRLSTIAFLLAASAALVPAAARAQMGGGGPGGGMGGGMGAGAPMPLVVDIKKIPVGSWGEYNIVGNEQMPPMKARFALVGRDAASTTVEVVMEGGMTAMMGGKMTMQMVTSADPTAPGSLKKTVMQIGDGDPMEMPGHAHDAKRGQFTKVDPKKLVGKEDVKVAAGSFKTEHYRDTNEHGAVTDMWVSKDVAPFGLVKMTITPPAEGAGAPPAGGPPGRRMGAGRHGPMTFELTAQGKGAKTTITKPAKPFDPAMMMGGMGMGGPGHPGMGGPGHPGMGGPGHPGMGGPPPAAGAPGAGAPPAGPGAPPAGKQK